MASPSLNFPKSGSTVRVRMVDATAVMVVPAQNFIQPVQPGHETLSLPTVAFLVEHEPSNQRVMFDLGVRKDFWNYPPVIQLRLSTAVRALRVDKDVAEILQEKGMNLDSFSAVIWSHYHWDHIGNMSLFPSSTQLVVGPGFKTAPNLFPGYPEKAQSPIPSSAFQDRVVTEIEFASDLVIGGFRAHDFFGDGSFYLLDTPGHCIGHMCGLARVTTEPESTFVLMGGDICHFGGSLRPSISYPLPDIIPSKMLDDDPLHFPSPCPCSIFTDAHPLISSQKASGNPQKTPFYEISTIKTSAYVDPATAQHSVNKLTLFDTSPLVMVCLAHDGTLLKYVPTLNDSPESDMSVWKAQGWKEDCHWGWLNEMPRKGTRGRKEYVEGIWRDGKPWETAKSSLRDIGEAEMLRNGQTVSGSGL